MTYQPLRNIRVVDFTWAAVGPYCTQLLASLGAHVIKVGSARQAGGMPPARAALVHAQLNYSKYSVALNLADPSGAELARRLIAVSDVVTENFRPGTMEKFGLSYKELVRVRPDLVMVSASFLGQEGPYSRYSAFAPVFGAMAGLSASTGLLNGIPTEMRMPMDYTIGLFMAQATLTALYHRARTGQGQHVDLSGRDAIACAIGDILMEAAVNGRDRPLMGNRDEVWAPHGAYPCREPDTWITVAVTCDQEWRALCRIMGRTDLADDPRYADGYRRWQRQEELDPEIGAWTREHTPRELTPLLQAAGVPAFPSYSARDLFEDPHLRERQFSCTVPGRHGQPHTVVAPPWLIDGQRPPVHREAPALGQDNALILGELLDLPLAELQALAERGVLQ